MKTKINILAIFCCFIAMAMFAPRQILAQPNYSFQQWCQSGGKTLFLSNLPSTTLVQQSFPNCTVSVYLSGTTTLATIYSDKTGTILSNPFTADDDAYFLFYAAPNVPYDITISGGGLPAPFTFPDVIVGIGGGGSSLLLQHNGVNLANQSLLNFDDTVPAAPGGFTNVIFQTDSSGKLSGYVPSGGGGGGCSTGGIATTNGTVTGDTSSTNCGFNNRIGDTATIPAGVSTFGFTNAGANSGQNVVAIGDNNATGNQASNLVAIGNTSGANLNQFPGSHDVVNIGDAAGDCFFGNCQDVVAIGDSAGNLTDGRNLVLLGNGAGAFTTANRDFLAMGQGAGSCNFGGPGKGSRSNVIAFGNGAVTNGCINDLSDVIGIGNGAGSNINGTSYDIISMGDGAGANYATGSHDNVSIGDGAGGMNLSYGVQTAFDIVAIGDAAGGGSIGHDVVAIGKLAVDAQGGTGVSAIPNSGTFIVGIGTQALTANTTGSNNVAIGTNAGANGFTRNVTVGNSNLTGSQNTWIGDFAGPNTTTQLSNTIALGYQAYNTASNQTVIGNSSITSLKLFGCPGGQSVLADGSGTCYTSGGGGGSLPSGNGIPTINSGTSWGPTIPQVPVENFGAVGYTTKAAAIAGTDSTSAIQACLNSLTQGQCVLQPRYYRTTGVLTIAKSYVGIVGTQPGGVILSAVASPSPSVIISTSATADIIDVVGTDANTRVLFNVFRDFAIERSTAPTSATAAGLSLNYSAGAIVERVQSLDSARGFYFHSAPSFGIGHIAGTWASWGLNGVTEGSGVALSGYYLDSADGNAQNSLMIDESAATSGLASSVTTHGMDIVGTAINDVDTTLFGTGNVSIGVYINYTGGGGVGTASDLHFYNCTNDGFFVSGFSINGIPASSLGSVNIVGGYNVSLSATGSIINIVNSSGVIVSDVQIAGPLALVGINATGSTNLVIANNQLLNTPTFGIVLNATTNSTVSGNKIHNLSGTGTLLALASTSTGNAVTGNSLSGSGAQGISVDATSINNTGFATNSITSSITTPITILGGDKIAGNITKYLTVSGCTITGTQCVVTSPGTSVTFSVIPGGYSGLEITANFNTSSGADGIQAQFNGDTGSNYMWNQIFAIGTSVSAQTSGGATTNLNVGASPGNSTSATNSGSFDILLPNYSNTTFQKTVIGQGTRLDSGSATVLQNDDGVWLSTAAITSIKLFPAAGENFLVGSSFSIIAKP